MYTNERHDPIDYAGVSVRSALRLITGYRGVYGYLDSMAMLHDAHGQWHLARQYRRCADRIQQMHETMRGLIEMEFRAAAAAE